MRITGIRERSIPISRYGDAALPSGGLTTSVVKVVTDVVREGKPVVGYGFSSIGRFAQGGLIRERFAPRLLAAGEADLTNDDGSNLDPFRAWAVMMKGEKPGGHGERCVAVGTLDMAMWDAAAKIADLPLYRFLGALADKRGNGLPPMHEVPSYAGGGYYYPDDDVRHLSEEIRLLLSLGYTHVKIKIGGATIEQDRRRIEAVLALLPSGRHLAVDAMNAYSAKESVAAASVLAQYGLWWFEDVCDPLDFETHAAVAATFGGPVAAGEALFSEAEAALLDRYGGLDPQRDILLFDPVHTYGLPGYLRIVERLAARGWPRSAFWPHGGHLFCQHVVSALGLGGCEVNPLCFQPFGGLSDEASPVRGRTAPPQAPGIGLETRGEMRRIFEELAYDAGIVHGNE